MGIMTTLVRIAWHGMLIGQIILNIGKGIYQWQISLASLSVDLDLSVLP